MKGTLLTRDDKALPARQLARCLVDIALARGADENKLLRGSGIFKEDLLTDKPLSCHQLQKLVHNASQQTQGFDLAFRFGDHLISAFVNDAMPYFAHTQNFGECLRALALFQTRAFPFISARRFDDKDNVLLILQNAMGGNKQFHFFVEAYCAALLALAKHCTGKRLLLKFEFPFARPRHIQEYEEALGFRISFGHPHFSIKIPRQALQTECLLPNPAFKFFALRRFKEQRQFKMTLLDAVRAQLLRDAHIGLPCIAAKFGMSPASLKRKLADHEVSFSSLSDEVGRQQAIYYLQIQKLNNEQSAIKMAFSDITNFRRTVKRLTGLTPSQLREV